MVNGEATSNEGRTCYFCSSPENERRIIGDFIVELVSVEYDNTSVLACQTCRRKAISNKKSASRTIKDKLGFLGFRKSKKI